MGLLDRQDFEASKAGQILKRIAEGETGGAPPERLGLRGGDTAALLDLERRGYVTLRRGAGAMAWRIEHVALTDAGRAALHTA